MKNNNSVSKALIKYIKEKEISTSQISRRIPEFGRKS